MIKIAFCAYFWESSDVARKVLSNQVPKNSYTWGDITAVTENEEPHYYVIFQQDTEFSNKIAPEKKIYLQREPVDVQTEESFKQKNLGYLQMYDSSFQFTKWWVKKSYDELKNVPFPQKTKKINTIVSHKRNLPGHVYRSDFVMDFMEKYPGVLDLYGSLTKTLPIIRKVRKYPFLESIYNACLKLPFIKIFIDFDKYEVMLPYSYSFVPENSLQENYFTEKIVDAYLSWSMPIYWGCPNISKYFPKDSYHLIDIYDPNALELMYDISQRPLTQKNIDAIAEARRLILDEYNIWPALDVFIKNFDKKSICR